MVVSRYLDFENTPVGESLISSEKVAHVQIGNSLEHAMLVLVGTGYSSIPVLDAKYKLHGLISTGMILKSIMGLERMEYERLEGMKVEDVMITDMPRLSVNDSLLKGLEYTINHPFVCVENEEGYFEGIFTRRVLLKKMNKLVLLLENMK